MGKIGIGINGFGRIGRCALKHLLKRDDVRVAGINDLADPSDLAYLLKYDSVHHWYPGKVSVTDREILVDGQTIPFFSQKDPAHIPWKSVGADVVLEASGAFRHRVQAAG